MLEVFCCDNELEATNVSSLNHFWIRFADISDKKIRNSAHGEVPSVTLVCLAHKNFQSQNFRWCSAASQRAGLEKLHALH